MMSSALITESLYSDGYSFTIFILLSSCMPHLSTLEVSLRQGTIQIHIYLYLYLDRVIVKCHPVRLMNVPQHQANISTVFVCTS